MINARFGKSKEFLEYKKKNYIKILFVKNGSGKSENLSTKNILLKDSLLNFENELNFFGLFSVLIIFLLVLL